MALLKHVDPWQPTSRSNQSLLHGSWIHQLPIEDCAGGQRRTGCVGVFLSVCWCQITHLLIHSITGEKGWSGVHVFVRTVLLGEDPVVNTGSIRSQISSVAALQQQGFHRVKRVY